MLAEMISAMLAGLGLFFVGVKFIGSHFKQMSGRGFRLLVARAVARPWQSALLGVVAGALTQSTNAVTFILTSMNAAGLISVRQAIPIVTWANVGTSALVLVATVDIHIPVLLLLGGVGLAFYLDVEKSSRWRHPAGALLGIALLFLGLQFIKNGAAPLRELQEVRLWLQLAGQYGVLLFLAGAAITLVLQSSATVSVIAVAMTHIGLISMEQTAIVIYGAGAGSAASLWLMTTNLHGTGRQLALLQIGFKLIAALLMVLLLVLEHALGVPLVLALVRQVSEQVSLQAAWVFLLYQVVGALAVTVLGQRLVRWLHQLSPPSVQEALSQPQYLYEQALDDAETALDLVEKEQLRLLGHLPDYLSHIDAARGVAPVAVRVGDRAVAGKVDEFLAVLMHHGQDRQGLDRMLNLQARNRLLHDLRDGLVQLDESLQTTRVLDGAGGPVQAVVQRMGEAMHFLLLTLHDGAQTCAAQDLALLQALASDRSDTMSQLRQKALQEAAHASQTTLAALFGATTVFERLVWLVRGYTQLLPQQPALKD